MITILLYMYGMHVFMSQSIGIQQSKSFMKFITVKKYDNVCTYIYIYIYIYIKTLISVRVPLELYREKKMNNKKVSSIRK